MHIKRGCTAVFLNCLVFGSLGIASAQEPTGSPTATANDSLPVAFGRQSYRKNTAAIATLNGEALTKTFAPTLTNALYGRLPGLTVLQGRGEPGNDAPTLYGRGRSGLTDGKILILVDGFESPMDDLVAEEVESVTYLKDAAAVALYGMRGSNGVLLVTTKKGVEGKTKVNFSASTGWQTPGDRIKPLGAYDYARLYNEALANDGKPLRYTDADLQAYRSGSDPYFHPNVNWQQEVLRKSAAVHDFDLNFRGGGKNVRFFVLLNAMMNNGLYANTDAAGKQNTNARYSKYNFRTNLDIDINKRLTASVYLGGRIEDRSALNGISSDSLFNLLLRTPPNAFPVHTPDKGYGGSSVYINPVAAVLGTGTYNNNNRNFQTVFTLKHKLDFLADGLSASGTFAFTNLFSGYSTQNRTFAMENLSKNANGDTVTTQIGQNTALTPAEGYSDQWRRSDLRAALNYDHSFGRHEISAMVMYMQEKYVIDGNNVPFANQNYAGKATWSYRKKYTAEVAASYMGTDNFPAARRFGLFPAVSAGWVISDESFLHSAMKDGFLKLRASYGKLGNDQIGGQRFMYDQYYFGQGGYNFGNANTGVGGIAEGSLANPDVTWEKKTVANLGFDGVIRQNWHFSLDVFTEKRYDIAVTPTGAIPGVIGASLPLLNLGAVRNKGFEAWLGYHPQTARAFNYYVEGAVSFSRNKILNMSEQPQPYPYLRQTGRSVGQPFGLQAQGFYQPADFESNGQLKAGLPVPQFGDVRPGDIKYKDQNNDHVIDGYDNRAIGRSPVPEWNYSFKLGFSFHQLSLEAFFQGVANRTVYLNGPGIWAFQNNAGLTSLALGRWTPETAQSADYPRLTTNSNDNNYRLSDLWQRNGSFLKLRAVELKYVLPQLWVKKVQLEQATLFVSANNLFSLDALHGMDPETLTGYPVTRVFSTGIKVGF